jgi:hypothetical protein
MLGGSMGQSEPPTTRGAVEPPGVDGNAELIDGLYVVERSLGPGPGGEVLACREPHLDRRVAVTILAPEVTAEPVGCTRLLRDLRALSKLQDPHIAAVLRVGEHRGAFYVATELLDAVRLDAFVSTEGGLGREEALGLVVQLARGLAQAHAAGVFHGAVAPESVLVARRGGTTQARLASFGMAAAAGRPSPAEPPGPAADLHGLALLALWLLGGSKAPEPAREALAGLRLKQPAKAELERALDPDPGRRHPDLASFAGALESALGSVAPGAEGELVACEACGQGDVQAGHYCPGCGAAAPHRTCPVCGAARVGLRIDCLDCAASLLPAAKHGRPLQLGGLAPLQPVGAAILVATWSDPSPPSGTLTGEIAQRFLAGIERERGVPLAVIGSEGTALFGLGTNPDEAVERAVDAGLALQRTFVDLAGAEPLPLRVGIDYAPVWTRGAGATAGSVVAAGEGLTRAREASRRVRPGGVAVAEDAYLQIRLAFRWYRIDDQHRGVDSRQPLRWHLPVRAVRGAELPVAGRRAALSYLEEAAAQVRTENRARVTVLTGPSGAGKSRVIAELVGRLEDSPDLWRLDLGRASPAWLTVAYEPFIEIIRTRLKLYETADPRDVAVRLTSLPGLGGAGEVRPELDRLCRLLGFPGLGPEAPMPRPRTHAERRAHMQAYASYLREATRQSPAAVVIEDLSGASPDTLELVVFLVRACLDVPILFVFTLAPDLPPAWLDQLPVPAEQLRRIELGPLGASEATELVAALLGDPALPEGLAELVQNASAGWPWAIEEVVDALIAGGALSHQEAAGWALEVRAAKQITAPGLEAMTLRRLDRLEPASRQLLDAIAVAGVSAPRAMLKAMLGDELLGRAEVEDLKRRGLILETRLQYYPGEVEYGLRLPVIRDLVARHVGSGERAVLAGKARAWLEAWTGIPHPTRDRLAARLAADAGDIQAASRHILAAITNHAQRFAYEDAGALCRQRVDLAKRAASADPESHGTLAMVVDAALVSGEMALGRLALPEALRYARQAESHATAAEDDEARIRALILQADVLRAKPDRGAAVELLTRATRTIAANRTPTGVDVHASGLRAWLLVREGALEEARQEAEHTLALAGSVPTGPDRARGVARASSALAQIASRNGDIELARRYHTSSRAEWRAAGDPVRAAMSTLALGDASSRAGLGDLARGYLEQALGECQALGYLRGIAIARTGLGEKLLAGGAHARAAEELERAERLARQLELRRLLPRTLLALARVHAATGEGLASRAALSEARSIARDTGDQEQLAAIERFAGGAG